MVEMDFVSTPFWSLAEQSLIVALITVGAIVVGGAVAWLLGRRATADIRAALREEQRGSDQGNVSQN